MNRVSLVALALVVTACGGGDAEPDEVSSSTSSTASPASTAAESTGAGLSGEDVCDVMTVDAADFATPEFADAANITELAELQRGPADAGWLRIDGAVGCFVELSAADGDRRVIGIEGYVFSPGVIGPAEFAQTFADANPSAVTADPLSSDPDVFVLIRLKSGDVWAATLAVGDRMVYVQSAGAIGDYGDTLVSIAREIADG